MGKTIRFVLLLLLAGCTEKHTIDIEVVDPWIAEIPPMISVTAALMTLRNHSGSTKYLVAASSPDADRIEIHRTFIVNDLARMQQQTEVEIPAGGSLSFNSSSGYHLMFYGGGQIQAGRRIPVTLSFRDGTKLTVDFPVRDRRSAN